MFGTNLKKIRESHGLSQDELGEKLGVSGKTVSSWEINRTEPKMGIVQQIADLFHVSTDDLIRDSNVNVKLPTPEPVRDILIYGALSCGTGLFVDDEVIGHVSVPLAMLPSRSAEYFAQYASGDSMEGVGIFDGDLLVFEKTAALDNGQIGCFCIDENIATCKKFSRIGGSVMLMPANDKYQPIIISPENECFRILGRQVLRMGK